MVGYVYFLRTDAGMVKIGRSTDPMRRITELARMNSSEVSLIGLEDVAKVELSDLERVLHYQFADYRVRGEWFNESADLVRYASMFTSHEFFSKINYKLDELYGRLPIAVSSKHLKEDVVTPPKKNSASHKNGVGSVKGPDGLYRLEYTKCNRTSCKKCQDGKGHGPYWYRYWWEGGKTRKKYVGKELPEYVTTEIQPGATTTDQNPTPEPKTTKKNEARSSMDEYMERARRWR